MLTVDVTTPGAIPPQVMTRIFLQSLFQISLRGTTGSQSGNGSIILIFYISIKLFYYDKSIYFLMENLIIKIISKTKLANKKFVL